jgi:hypothetical protein
MTDTITREHVEAATAALTATVARLTEERESEARQFTEKKRLIVQRGWDAATSNGIGERFDDMMEEIGLPRRPVTREVWMYLTALMPTQPDQRIGYLAGSSTYGGPNVLVTLDLGLVVANCTVRSEEDTCACDSATYQASRYLDSYFGMNGDTPNAAAARIQVGSIWCRHPGCPNSQPTGYTAGVRPGVPFEEYIPADPVTVEV